MAWSFSGQAKRYETLSEAVIAAHDGMGAVWKDGTRRLWERWNRPARMQIESFDSQEDAESAGSSVAQCLQLLLHQKADLHGRTGLSGGRDDRVGDLRSGVKGGQLPDPRMQPSDGAVLCKSAGAGHGDHGYRRGSADRGI